MKPSIQELQDSRHLIVAFFFVPLAPHPEGALTQGEGDPSTQTRSTTVSQCSKGGYERSGTVKLMPKGGPESGWCACGDGGRVSLEWGSIQERLRSLQLNVPPHPAPSSNWTQLTGPKRSLQGSSVAILTVVEDSALPFPCTTATPWSEAAF